MVRKKTKKFFLNDFMLEWNNDCIYIIFKHLENNIHITNNFVKLYFRNLYVFCLSSAFQFLPDLEKRICHIVDRYKPMQVANYIWDYVNLTKSSWVFI